MNDTEEGFVGRWSRRKREEANVGREAATGSPDPASERLDPAPYDPPRPVPDTPVTEAAAPDGARAQKAGEVELPPIESLDGDSDYTPFMDRGVSTELHRLALAKLFRQPCFNLTDGLDDYAEDFTRHEVLGETVSHEMRRALASASEPSAAEEKPPAAAVENPAMANPVGDLGEADQVVHNERSAADVLAVNTPRDTTDT